MHFSVLFFDFNNSLEIFFHISFAITKENIPPMRVLIMTVFLINLAYIEPNIINIVEIDIIFSIAAIILIFCVVSMIFFFFFCLTSRQNLLF